MFSWLREKFGINLIVKDIFIMDDKVDEANTKLYELIQLNSKLMFELDKQREEINNLKAMIKNVPKEMTIKNVLGVC